jgi:hypothetical protein
MSLGLPASIFLVAVGLVAVGCTGPEGGDTAPDSGGSADSGVTWNNRIGPLVAERCAACHQEGRNNLALSAYEQFAAVAELAYDKMAGSERAPYVMPPWPIPDSDRCTPPQPWRDDPRIQPDELAAVRTWIDEGMPLGPAEEEIVIPAPLGLTGERTERLPSVNFTVPARTGDEVDYTQCFSLPLNRGGEDAWIDALYLDNPGAMIHHIIVASDPFGETGGIDPPADAAAECAAGDAEAGQMLFTWISDNGPFVLPPDSGMYMPAGSRLVLAIHYHIKETEQYDDTQLVVRWTEGKPKYRAWMDRFGGASESQVEWTPIGYRGGWADPPFSIPADTPDHYEQWNETWGQQDRPQDGYDEGEVAIWSVFPHMHYAGSNIRMLLKHPDGREDCLSHIERFDFAWQNTYPYDAPVEALPRIAPDDEIEIQCHYTNTMENDRLRNALLADGYEATFDMTVGEGSLREMCVLHFGALMPEE